MVVFKDFVKIKRPDSPDRLPKQPKTSRTAREDDNDADDSDADLGYHYDVAKFIVELVKKVIRAHGAFLRADSTLTLPP